MAIRNIVKEGDGILGKKCRPVEKFDPKLWMLLDDMKETLREANGVGLAAPQVGILRRVVIVNIGDEDGDIELDHLEGILFKAKASRMIDPSELETEEENEE